MNTILSKWTRLAMVVAAPAMLVIVPAPARGQDRAVPRGQPAAAAPSAPAPAPASGGGQRTRSGGSSDSGARAVPRDAGTRSGGSSASEPTGGSTARRDSGASPRSGATEAAVGRRERGDQPAIATAVPRRSRPGDSGGGGSVVIVPGGYGFYPWGYGGLGLGGYYGGYYDPFDPFGGYGGYGGSGGGYGYGGYGGGYPYYADQDDDGAVKIKVKPRDASVYVDGYFVGRVDDFDGVFQRLHLASGPHRLEIRAPEYEPLMVDVRIEPDHTITYRGEMRRIN